MVYPFKETREAVKGRGAEILMHYGMTAEQVSGKHTACYKCGGDNRARYDSEQEFYLCNQCFNKANGDIIAAVAWMNNWKPEEACVSIAKHLGIKQEPATKAKKDPTAELEFLPWDDLGADTWCLWKPPITPAALRSIGARMARKKKTTVIALPVWGERLNLDEPVGWVLYNIAGGDLFKKVGDGYEPCKVKLSFGSTKGIMLDLARLARARVVIKVEGPPDLLSMLSLDDLPDDVCPISTSCGAGQKHEDWILNLFAGKESYILGDNDDAGDKSVDEWAPAIAEKAANSICRQIELPFPGQEKKGQDLRDYLNEAPA